MANTVVPGEMSQYEDFGVAYITQLSTCVIKIVTCIQRRSPNVVKVIFHLIRKYS